MIQLIAVFAENRSGWLARVTGTLADAGLNIHWLGIASVERFGVIRLLVDRPDLAHQRLQAAGFTVSLVDVLAAEVEDRPGSLHVIAQRLSQQGLSLSNCSGFVFNRRAILLLELDDLARAAAVLADAGVRLLTPAQLLTL
jgi:hypothetical protein